MPEKSSPITLDMQQDVTQAQRWHRQTRVLTDDGSKSQLKQSWDGDGPGDSQMEDTRNDSSAFFLIWTSVK